jgi:hypothetical protein
MRKDAWCIGASFGVAVVLVFWLTRPPVRQEVITEPRVVRIISNDRCEWLPVYRVSVGGTSVRNEMERPKAGRIPVLRIDFLMDGQPISLWAWDDPIPVDR